ncbi:MAG: glucan ABC transporter ATP-binding protein/ permease [Desulfovibrionales bacterium]|nr:glucan ABC transporter ATP-binding protein/ permease [Desulfovibrionales bacterium]
MQLLHLYMRVLRQLGPETRLASVLVAANLGLAIAQFAEPVLFGRIIDALSRAQGSDTPLRMADLAPLLAAWVGFGLFVIGAGVLVALHADRLAHRRRLAIMAHFFEHALNLPLNFHAGMHSGRLFKVMLEGAGTISALLLNFLRENCAAALSLVVLLPLSLFLNWRLAMLLLCLVGVFTVLTTVVLRYTETLQGQVQQHHNVLAERTTDALGNVPVIQSFTRIEAEVLDLRKTIDRLLAAQIPVLSWWALAAVATRAAVTLTVLSILLAGTWLYMHGQATVGDIVTFMTLAGMLIAKLQTVVGFVNTIFLEAPKLRDFFDVLDTVPQVRNLPGSVDAGRLEGVVEFDGVGFSYPAARDQLPRMAVQGLSFRAHRGETIAMVGATGSGKSTTLSLLHRVFDPQQGAIRIDGKDIRDYTLTSLRRNIGVVFQEPMLFARTIEENLRVGNPSATRAQLLEACERAQAMDLLERQPGGLNALVAERGRSLSGGERQRLSIARALLKNPPILILDEATSALDAATEVKVQAALDEVMRDRTTFVIAHRLATVRNADRILVFEDGRIVESGSFGELISLGGRFATLARAQLLAPEP